MIFNEIDYFTNSYYKRLIDIDWQG